MAVFVPGHDAAVDLIARDTVRADRHAQPHLDLVAADRRRRVDLDRHLRLLISGPRTSKDRRGVSEGRRFAYAIGHSAARLHVAPKISTGRLSSDPLASFRDGILGKWERSRVGLREGPYGPRHQNDGEDKLFHLIGIAPTTPPESNSAHLPSPLRFQPEPLRC